MLNSPLAYEHNGEPVDASTFYAIACDPRRPVVVEACAGAGKTWMLVSRMVRALLQGMDPVTGELGVRPNDILAITFTKRAAGEMRERLQQWLLAFSQADESALTNELAQRGVVVASLQSTQLKGLQQSLKKLYAALLATGRQIQIRTFHSWFANLVGAAPLSVLLKLGLPPNYELLEDDKRAISLVWRRFYASLLQSPQRRADFEALVQEHGRFQAEKALTQALSKRLEFSLADAAGVLETSIARFDQYAPGFGGLDTPDEWLTGNARRLHVVAAAAMKLGRAKAATFSESGAALELAMQRGDVDGAISALFTQKMTPRKFNDKLEGIEQVREAQDLLVELMAARAQHAAWTHQQRMTRLTRLLVEQFSELKRERGWVDMNDLEIGAKWLLGDPVLSGWVQQSLDSSIRHLLVDEFQDTSPLQWHALYAWLSAYAGSGAGEAPSVFIVGDPKQSIYRFRRADPKVFQAAKAFLRQGLHGDWLTCDHTRRNASEVVATVNRVMTDAVAERFAGDVYDGYRAHTTGAPAGGCVLALPPIPRSGNAAHAVPGQSGSEVAGLPSDGLLPPGTPAGAPDRQGWRDSLTQPQSEPEEALRTREARQVANWIATQLRARSGGAQVPGDFMVLARKRAALGPLRDELRLLGVASQIGEKTSLYDSCEVQDVVALVDLLVSEQHDLSLARVLKSPLFGVPDDALVEIALAYRTHIARGEEARLAQDGSTPSVCWFDLLVQNKLIHPKLQGVGQRLQLYGTWIHQLPPHDALQAIYSHGDVLARYAKAAPPPARQAVLTNLQALLWVALQVGGGRFITPYRLVRVLKSGSELAPAAVHPDAVQLLTIHGAKGLEAHTVVMLDTDALPAKAESMGVLVDWEGVAEAPRRFLFMTSETKPPGDAVALMTQELQERRREEINALYVAMTRARRRLVLSSIEPSKKIAASWRERFEGLAQTLEAPGILSPLEASDASASASDSRLFDLKVLPAYSPPNDERKSQKDTETVAHLARVPNGEAPDARGGQPALPVASRAAPESAPESAPQAAPPDTYRSRMGEALHRLLQWGEITPQAAQAAAELFRLDAQAAQGILAMAERIRHGEGVWAWNSANLAFEGNEVELQVNGKTLFIDRLVQRADSLHWWVLDYKSAHQPERDASHVTQLSKYRDAIQAIYPRAVVRAAFLTSAGRMIELTSSE